MKLYQINQSLYAPTVEADWVASLQAGDSVLFFEAGVLRALHQSDQIKSLDERGILLFYRQADLDAYGVGPLLGHGLCDAEWVELTTRSHSVISW